MAGIIEVTAQRLRAVGRHGAGSFRAPDQRKGLVAAAGRLAKHVAAEKAAATDD
jgi:hypothetical protein